MYLKESFTLNEDNGFFYSKSFLSLIILVLILSIATYITKLVSANAFDEEQTFSIVSNPKIDDIYFLDNRLMREDIRPKHNYRIAKVVDITGHIVTLLYGSLYYERQNAAENSVRYGQLSYTDYFETKRFDIPKTDILDMAKNGVIYLAKRPVRNKLFGNFIGPAKEKASFNIYTYGSKENIQGEVFLNEKYNEKSSQLAFEQFELSAQLGFAKGQVNLAEMYINGNYVNRDLTKALQWLKEASLQSYKPAILKYEIVCKQVPNCNIINFFKELNDSGVNIKVRHLEFELSKSSFK